MGPLARVGTSVLALVKTVIRHIGTMSPATRSALILGITGVLSHIAREMELNSTAWMERIFAILSKLTVEIFLRMERTA